MYPFKSVFLMLLSPSRFISEVTEHMIAEQLREHPELRDAKTGEYPADKRAKLKANTQEQTVSIRQALFGGVCITLVTIAVGSASGLALQCWLGAPSKAVVYLLQAAGAGVILGATLGEIGREIETYGRKTIPEQVNKLMFRWLYIVGTFLFVVSVTWDW